MKTGKKIILLLLALILVSSHSAARKLQAMESNNYIVSNAINFSLTEKNNDPDNTSTSSKNYTNNSASKNEENRYPEAKTKNIENTKFLNSVIFAQNEEINLREENINTSTNEVNLKENELLLTSKTNKENNSSTFSSRKNISDLENFSQHTEIPKIENQTVFYVAESITDIPFSIIILNQQVNEELNPIFNTLS